MNRLLPEPLRQAVLEGVESGRIPCWTIGARAASELELIATGAYSPLEGFMGPADYRGVVQEMRLASGLVWTLPVVLPVPDAADTAGEVALRLGPEGPVVGFMQVEHRFRRDPEADALALFGTGSLDHPGVASLLREGEWLAGGPVWLVERPPAAEGWEPWRMDPAETRLQFARRGWRRVVGFQTRNPVHRAHEYLMRCALEVVDGLLLHPLIGETKAGDLSPSVRLRAYRAVLEAAFPADRVMLAGFPAPMRYAGPREAIFHALCRKNHGCTHFVIGRDHAGVGQFYGPYDAHRLFDRVNQEQPLGIHPLYFEDAFHCRECGGMATLKSCPHPPGARLALSGTRVRAMLAAGEAPPREFTRPEVARILREAMATGGV